MITSRAGALPTITLREFAQKSIFLFVIEGDASDTKATAAMLAWVHEHLPHAEEYVHAAGKSGFAMLENLHDGELLDVARPKVSHIWLFSQPTAKLHINMKRDIYIFTKALHISKAKIFL